ncbi:MAG: tetratricopeptide repeat protein, partial [Gammaproteobacteria bacterium]|nr:tetratricopeptide repeat protein [Gammaproteobacteria bacterium]
APLAAAPVDAASPPVATTADAATPADLYRRGEDLARKGQIAEAVEILIKARAAAPDNLDVLNLLATIYANTGRLDEAVAIYDEIIRITAPESEAHGAADHQRRFIEATKSAKAGDILRARTMFEELAKETPDDLLVLYSLGVAQMLGNQFDAARASFRRVLQLDPGYLNAYINLSRIDQQSGDLRGAGDLLRKVIDLSPAGQPAAVMAQLELNLIEANLLLNDGNDLTALDLYEKVLKTRPDELRALVPAAAIYQRLGKHEKASQLYEHILVLAPQNSMAKVQLAAEYMQSDRVEAAYNTLLDFLRSAPNDPLHDQALQLFSQIAATPLGRSLEERRSEQEIAELEKRVGESPDDMSLRHELATIYLKKLDWDKALPHLEVMRDHLPDDAWTRLALATAYDQLSRFEETVNEYSWLVMHETNDEPRQQYVRLLLLAIGKYLYAGGKTQLAGDAFGQLLDQDPGNVLANFYMGLISARENHLQDAVDNYQRVLRLVPTHVGARLNLATSYESLNREEDALDEYHKILASNPPKAIADAARARIAAVEKRIRGFDGAMSYATTLDGNSNLSQDHPKAELRSDLSLNLNYRYKMANGIRWRGTLSPSYTNYHYNQIDFINMSMTLSADYGIDGTTFVGGFTRNTSQGLVTASRSSDSNTLFAEGLRKVNLPHLLALSVTERVPTDVQADFSYTRFNSTSSPFFSAWTVSGGINLGQPLWERSMGHVGYNYVKNNNLELIGSDYAYRSHGVTAKLEQGYGENGVMTMQYGFTLYSYMNADSFSRFTRTRRNTKHTVSIGTTYGFKRGISLFANLIYESMRSNLPVGVIINAEDVIEGQQSSSLSDYERATLNFGVNLSF